MNNETTASQPKSIGDDAQFWAELSFVRLSNGAHEQIKRAEDFLVPYLDSKLRAPAAQASATIQAAPYAEGHAIDFTRPLETTSGNPVAYICADMIEYECARLCVDQSTGLVYSGPYPGMRIRNVVATIQEPVMVAEPAGDLISDIKKAIRLADAVGVSRADNRYARNEKAVEELVDLELSIYRRLAAPMVADPAGVAVYQMRTEGGKRDWVEIDEEKFNDLPGYGLYSNVHKRMLVEQSKVATVKAVPSEALTGAAHDVLAERRRQVEAEGWTVGRDDNYKFKEMAKAATCYIRGNRFVGSIDNPTDTWPWDHDWWKPTTYRRNLVKAGALLLAEIERIDRAAPLADKTGGGE